MMDHQAVEALDRIEALVRQIAEEVNQLRERLEKLEKTVEHLRPYVFRPS